METMMEAIGSNRMGRRAVVVWCLTFWVAVPAAAEVLRVADLNTRRFARSTARKPSSCCRAACSRSTGRTCRPSPTASSATGYPGARTGGAAECPVDRAAISAAPVRSSGSNEIGGQYVFPGTYAVRPSTLRAIYMDLATELGDRASVDHVVHVHGSPMHIGALDQAGDFFHDTYGGRMVNLWGWYRCSAMGQCAGRV